MKKYVLAQPGGFSNTIKENLLVIKQAGYDGVFFSAEYSGVNDELIEYTRGIGLDIETIHLPYSKKAINTLWDDTKDPEESFEILRKGIDLAARNKVKTVILHTCNGYHPPEIGETGLKNYRYLAQYCKDRGIILALENNKSFEHLKFLLDNLSDFDNVKLCFDIGHANAFTKNLSLEVWDSLLDKLWCVHIHDNDGTKDAHLIPYMGTIDISYWIKIIAEKKKDINLTLEIYYMDRVEYYGEITPEEFYAKSITAIKRIKKETGIDL